MCSTDDKATRGGFTLLEILTALAIVGILVALSLNHFAGLNEKYKVEAETKQLYADLMDARGRAMQRNRIFFVRFSGTGYATYEDTNTSPDGNGIWDNAADTRVANVTVRHTITTALTGGATVFEFNRNGIASVTGNLRLSSTTPPDYDCITIGATRIKMGQYIGGVCVEK